MTDKMREALARLRREASRIERDQHKYAELAYSPTADLLESIADDIEASLSEQPAQGATATGPRFTYGHCADRRQVGGCIRHNLHCGYPDCDRKEVPRG